MLYAIKQHVIVQADGVIEVHAPELKAGMHTEVIILEAPGLALAERSLGSFIGTGHGSFATAEQADAFLRAERDAWE